MQRQSKFESNTEVHITNSPKLWCGLLSSLPIIALGVVIGFIPTASGRSVDQQQTNQSAIQDQDEKSRQIVRDEFTKSRPVSTTGNVQKAVKTTPSRPTTVKRPRYTRKNPVLIMTTVKPPDVVVTASTAAAVSMELGVTIWRLRPSKANEAGARVLVMESAQSTQWTPERIEADAPLRVGERVRISVESPRSGYLYVIDREQYRDGSLGDAYLIFPTRRTRGGDNRVKPGMLIDIPAQEDNPSYFTLIPTTQRSDQVAEVLTFVVTSEPLEGLPIGDNPLRLSNSDVAKWEAMWSGNVERFEMEGGAGLTWTTEEKEAGSTASARLLTQEGPAPQTIYRISTKSKSAFLVTVPLRYSR